VPARRQLAFINDESKIDKVSTEKFKSSMSSTMSDADAYHEMVSAAVDLSSVYARNGILTGWLSYHLMLSSLGLYV
jgi:hypothetical protein